jgi:hypothetical protein
MSDQRSKISPLIFGISLLCFILPFVTLSCGGHEITTLSGVQLAIGTTVQEPQVFGPPQKTAVDPDPFASLAVLCAVFGIFFGFVSKSPLPPAISGALGAMSLLLMKAHLTDQILKRSQGILLVSYESGFTLVLLLLAAAGGWNGYLLLQTRSAIPAAVESMPIAPGTESSG